MSLLFEKFDIIECLKKGPVTSVFLANHVYLDKKIILKTLDTAGLKEPELQERFKQEAKILARLDHPNIINVLDFGIHEKTFYISFEYFKSQTLREFLEHKTGNAISPGHIVRQIISALAYAHSFQIIHRDLKPENILIDETGLVKIADFGFALISSETAQADGTPIVGTPAYMSPEQIRGEVLSVKSDLFSCGIIIYEAYSGVNPFIGKDTSKTLNNILKVSPSLLERHRDLFPENVYALLLRTLVNNPEKRLLSASAMLEYFGIPEKEKQPSEDISGQSPLAARKRRHFIPVAAILFILGVTLVYFSFFFHQAVVPTTRVDSTASPAFANRYDSTDHYATGEGNYRLQNEYAATSPDSKALERKNNDPSMNRLSGNHEMVYPGELYVECSPWAYVIVDSIEFDSTPMMEPIHLSAGSHELILLHPDYPSIRKQIHVPSGQRLEVKMNLDTLVGFLHCDVHPWAEVYVDGGFHGQTPLTKFIALTPGMHEIVFRNPKEGEFNRTIHVDRGDTLSCTYNFRTNIHFYGTYTY